MKTKSRDAHVTQSVGKIQTKAMLHIRRIAFVFISVLTRFKSITSTLLHKAVTALAITALFVPGSVLVLGLNNRAIAAESTYINFQARILQSNGALVPDGTYHVEFKLYDVSTSGTALWTETRDTTTTDVSERAVVKNGYIAARLGSVTSFPSNISWNDRLYLSMNIGGTGASPAWDGEMSPRFTMTSVPYAKVAKDLRSSSTSTTSTNSDNVSVSTGNATGATSNSGNITIDTGTATGTTGTISIAGTNASGLSLGRAGLQTTVVGNALISGGTLTIGSDSQQGNLIVFDGSNNSVTLVASNIDTSYSLTLPTAAGSTDQCLRTSSTTASQLVFGSCGTNGAVISVGTIDSQTKNSDGAVIASGVLYMQTADASNVGLVSTGTQTFAGNKTFTGTTTFSGAANVTSGTLTVGADSTTNGTITLYSSGAVADPTISANASGDLTLQSTAGTTVVGDGSGGIQLQLTNAADSMTATQTFTAGSGYSGNDFSFTRTVTGVANSLQGNVLQILDNSTTSSGTFTPTLLYLNQVNTSAAGYLINAAQNGTSKFSVTPAGATTIAGSLTVNNTALFKPSSDSTTAFQIQPSASTTPVLNVDTTNSRVGIGTNAPTDKLEITGGNLKFTNDDTGILFYTGERIRKAYGGSMVFDQAGTWYFDDDLYSGKNFTAQSTLTSTGLATFNGGLTIETGDTLTFNGDSFTDLTGTGLTVSSGALQATLGTSVSNAELENSIIGVNSGSGLSGGGNISLGGSRTLSLGPLTADWVQTGGYDIVLDNSASDLRILESSGGLYYGEFEVGDLSATRLYTFPNASGEVTLLGQTIDNVELANSSVTVNTSTGLSGGGALSLGGSLTLTALLGDTITSSEITNGEIIAEDLKVSNTLGAGVNGYVMTYNNTTGGFTLIDVGTLNTNGVDTINSLSGSVGITGNTQISVGSSGNNVTLSVSTDSITSSQLAVDSVGSSELAVTSVTAGSYGSGSSVATFTVDADGRLTSASSTSIAIAASQITSGILGVSFGGTGATTLTSGGILFGNGTGAITDSGVLTAGQLLIGDGTGAPTVATLTQGTGITITNGAGSITIDSTLGTAIDSTEITDSTITAVDLSQTNTATNGYVLTYDSVSGGFTWAVNSTSISEATVEGYIFDADNTGTLSSGTLALGSLSYTGSLQAANGGTGLTSAGTSGGVYYSTGSAFANSGAGTAGQCLLSGGSGAPSWGNCGGSGGGAVTLQVTYDNGNSITTSDNRNIAFTLADTTTDADLIINMLGTGNLFDIQDSGTSKLTVESANGYIGVNDSTPSYQLDVAGTGRFTDAVLFDGNVTIGNASTDTVTFTGRSASSILPSVDDTYDLGSSTNRWRDLYLGPDSVNMGSNTTNGSISFNTTNTLFGFNRGVSITGALSASGAITFGSFTTAGVITNSASGVLSSAATLGVSLGGTGASTFTANGVIYGNTTSALQATAAGTSGQLLVANASGVPVFVSMSGDVAITATGATTIQANSVDLTTDTNGNYLASVSNGTGIAVTGSAGEGWTATVALDYSSTLTTNSLATNTSSFASTGLIFEGSTADAIETLLTVTDPTTADKTITLPNASGTVAVSASGNIALSALGNITFTGTLAVSNGGTGATTLTSGGILFGNGTGAITDSGVLTAGQLLIGDGTGAPTVGTLTQGSGITVTNGAGSITIASTLGTAIDSTEITDGTIKAADLLQTNAATNGYVLSYDSAGGGFTWISGSAFATNEATVEGYIFDADNTGTLSSGTLALGSLSYTGSLQAANGGTGLTGAGTAGGVYYSTGTAFANSGVGTSGQCLLSNGASAPSWGTCGGGGGSVTLQMAYDNGATITTTDNKNIAFNLADTTTDADLIVDMLGTGNVFDIRDLGVSKFTVDGSNGFVGVNDSTPSYNLDVAGTGRFTGAVLFDGNVTIGDTTTDTVTFTGRSASSILPSADNTYALGSSALRWADLFVGPNSINIGSDINNGTISYDTTSSLFGISKGVSITGALSVSTTLSVTTSVSTPIYYDSNNTAYYLDPASTSNINTLAINGIITGAGSNSTYGALTVQGNKGAGDWSGISFRSSAGTFYGTLMAHPSYSGWYNNTDDGWDWLWNDGTLSAGTVPTGRLSGTFPASSLSGQSGMWTSANRPGAYRLYRNDNDSAYNVQTYWTGARWRLRGYLNDSYHAESEVYYSDAAGSASTASLAYDLNNAGTSLSVYYHWTGATASQTGSTCYWTTGSQYRITRCNSSSGRYKENIQSYASGLDKVTQLNPVYFNYRQDSGFDTTRQYSGFIAEEVEAIDPTMVMYNSDGQVETVDYGKLTVVLTNAVKELYVQVQDIEGRLSVIESGELPQLHVAGDATVDGSLTVNGDTSVQNITINGKIITAGNAPAISLGDAANGYSAVATISGNDTTGTITFSPGQTSLPYNTVSAGVQTEVTFNSPYSSLPRINLTPASEASAQIKYYVERSITGFKIKFVDAPTENVDYTFDYLIAQ